MDLEDCLPTISESYRRMSRIDKYHLEQIYYQSMKFLKEKTPRPNRILDAACGDAFVLNWLDGSVLQAGGYIGVDISRKKIKQARELIK